MKFYKKSAQIGHFFLFKQSSTLIILKTFCKTKIQVKKILYKYILPIIYIQLLLTSCKKDIENRLLGDAWSSTSTKTENGTYTKNGQSYNLKTKNKITIDILKFNDNGTGSSTKSNGDVESFNWSSNGEKEIKITTNNVGQLFEVSINEKDEQVWNFEETTTESLDEITFTNHINIESKLTRD